MSTSSTPESPPVTDQPRWFADEVHAHDSQLKAYLSGSFPSIRDVEDVVQESYLRIWKARARHPIHSARAFLFRIARHLALDTIRHKRASPFDDVTDFVVSHVIEDKRGVEETAAINQEVELLMGAIDRLPARCREILILHKLRRLSRKEVAARLGLSEQTVSVQMTRAIQKCETYLLKKGVRL